MAAPDTPAAEEQRWRRRRRAAILLWAAFAVVVWNVVFDAVVIEAGRDYLTRQALHQQGQGPGVTIPSVMRPGVLRGVRLASLFGGGVAGCGLVAVWVAARCRRTSRLSTLAE
jgi:ABC-type Fe3+ transport system permease subunit